MGSEWSGWCRSELSWAFLHQSNTEKNAGFQTPRRVIPLKNYRIAGEPYGIEPTRADIWAGGPTVRQIGQVTTCPSRVQRWVKKRKPPLGLSERSSERLPS